MLHFVFFFGLPVTIFGEDTHARGACTEDGGLSACGLTRMPSSPVGLDREPHRALLEICWAFFAFFVVVGLLFLCRFSKFRLQRRIEKIE